jgi:hypothetical protein
LEHGQVHDVSSAEEKEDTDRKPLNFCRKKQWHTFKMQGVNRKIRVSLGLTTGVRITYSVPSSSMRRRIITSNPLEDKDRQLESLLEK